MNIKAWGNKIQQNQTWQVTENDACGYIRLYKIHSGIVYYHNEKGTSLLKENCIYLFPSHVSYRLTCENQDDFKVFWLHLDAMPYILDKLICIDDNYSPIFFKLCDVMQELINDNNDCEQEISYCCEILLKKCEQLSLISKLEPSFYQLVMALKDEALTKTTVKEFALASGFSTEYFTRLFKDKVKQSPYQFVLDYKMSRARELLRDGINISQVCELIGYNDPKSFDKIFKKKHGYTASQYKKSQGKYF